MKDGLCPPYFHLTQVNCINTGAPDAIRSVTDTRVNRPRRIPDAATTYKVENAQLYKLVTASSI